MRDPTEAVTRSLVVDVEDGACLRLTRARLLVDEGEDEGEERTLGEAPLVVGRGRDADLRLSDSTVSRRHFRIVAVAGGWSLEDLASRSGTRVNDQVVTEAALRDGDRIEVGATRLTFRVGEDELKAPSEVGETFQGLRTRDPGMRRLFGLARKVAPLDFPVLIQGETGTGKEGLARALHQLGAAPEGPFVTVDCTLLQGEHLRSELFGHARGAFTGASEARKGAFLRADGGTLFLDELGELPLALQPALLRALELGEVSPLGSERTHAVRVRVVAATHRDLRAQVEAGAFRADLLYRLSAVVLRVPPLRDRREDVLFLARHFLGEGRRLTPDAADKLQAHDWPGNVRELRQAVEVAAQLVEGPLVRARDLTLLTMAASPPSQDPAPEPAPAEPRPASPEGLSLLEQGEVEAIRRALAQTGGNQSEAAELLGINRSTLYRKMRRFGLK